MDSKRKKKKTGKALSKSEELFLSTFEQAAVGMAHVAPGGRFLRINQKFCDIVGYSRNEMLKRTFQDITHPDDLNTDLEYVRQMLAGEIPTYSLEKRYFRKSGEIVWVNLTVSLVRNEAKQPQWFVSVVEEITQRKQMIEKLRESEEKFRLLIEQSPFSIQILKTDGRIDQVNEAFKKLWGIPEETLPEVLEKYNILEDEEVAKRGVLEDIRRAFSGEIVILPLIEYDATKTMARLEIGGTEAKKVWLKSNFYPVKNRKGDIVNIVNIEQDMTKSKRAEENLKQTRSYIEQLMKTANVIIVNLDKKGRVLHLNPAGERITGYAFSELKGKSWFETLVPRDKYPYVHEEFMRLMKGGLPKLFENPILTKSGEERFISWTNSEIKGNEKSVGVISFGIDVTENKHALEALRESEQKFRDLVEQSPAVFELYNKDGTLIQINPAFERLWNLSRDDVIGKYNVFKSEQVKKSGFIPYFEKAFSGEAATPPDIEFDASLEDVDNREKSRKRFVSSFIYPVKDLYGNVTHVVMIHEDITEQKHAEEQMNELRTELLHSNRAGSMVELTGALAHELNHPLGSILNNANAARRILGKENPDIDEVREIIDDIISEDRRASDVILKLRALMKKTEIEFAPHQINDIVEEVLRLLQSELIIKNVTLVKNLEEGLPKVQGDRTQLQQVLVNLIINANDAMKESETKQLFVSSRMYDNKTILVSIKDTGHGIDEKEKEKLFKPFITTKKEGMGMGLSVCRTIIKEHGGDIWTENDPEGGASFFITLPLQQEKEA